MIEISNLENDCNLNIPRYIKSSEQEDLHDLNAHLNGGIPNSDIDALDNYWQVFPTLRNVLFKENNRPKYSELNVETHQVRDAILNHDEFTSYWQQIDAVFQTWRKAHQDFLLDLEVKIRPKKVIHRLSEDLLKQFTGIPLLDAYDVYQRLMDYWDDVMQDDVYLIVRQGWVDAAKPEEIIPDKGKKIKETPDLTIKKKKYKMDLIPPALIINCYFKDQQDAIEILEAKQADAESTLEEFVEEHTGEDGALLGLEGKSGIPMGNVQNRVMAHREVILKTYPEGTPQHLRAKAIKKSTFGDTEWTQDIGSEDSLFNALDLPHDDDENGLFEELGVLHECLRLLKAKKQATDAHKQALNDLHISVLKKYSELNEAEVKTLVVKDKWLPKIQSEIENEVQQVTQELTGRVKKLEKRYAQPLPDLEQEVDGYSMRVSEHLREMGAVRNE